MPTNGERVLVLLFKGKASQVWKEWDECVKNIGHMTLGQLRPKEMR